MVFFTEGSRRQSKRLVILSFVIFISLPLFSQEFDELNKEEKKVILEIFPKKIITGQRFDLTIFADYASFRDVKIKEPELPDGISLVSGPHKSAQTVLSGDEVNPHYIKKTRIFYKYKAQKSGVYNIGSFSLTDGINQLNTEPIMFSVLNHDEKALNYPIFAKWKSIPDTMFVGETIPIILEMENLEELTFPDRISIEPPSGGVFEKVDGVGEISVSSIGDNEVYIAPIESWLLTPTNSGNLIIPPATVSYGDITRSTMRKRILVSPLPAAVENSGAIGNFVVSVFFDDNPEDNINTSIMRIRVEGDGNLSFLRMPQPDFSKLTLVKKEENYTIEPSVLGYSGFREDIYYIGHDNYKSISIDIANWNWINKKSGKIEYKNFEKYNLQMDHPVALNNKISIRDKYKLLSTKKILKYRISPYKIHWYYLLLLPGIIAVLFALLQSKNGIKFLGLSLVLLFLVSFSIVENREIRIILDNASESLNQKDYQKTLSLYKEALLISSNNPGLYYNIALLNYDLENRTEVIYNLRKSLLLKPGNKLFFDTLNSIEEEYMLEHQVSSSPDLSPDLLFALFIVLFNFGAFVIVINIRRRRIEYSIFLILIFLLSFLSLGLMLFTDISTKRATAVISSGGGDLKKVPGQKGGAWLVLQEGTAVFVISEANNSSLIRTGYGLEGWIDKNCLLALQGN